MERIKKALASLSGLKRFGRQHPRWAIAMLVALFFLGGSTAGPTVITKARVWQADRLVSQLKNPDLDKEQREELLDRYFEVLECLPPKVAYTHQKESAKEISKTEALSKDASRSINRQIDRFSSHVSVQLSTLDTHNLEEERRQRDREKFRQYLVKRHQELKEHFAKPLEERTKGLDLEMEKAKKKHAERVSKAIQKGKEPPKAPTFDYPGALIKQPRASKKRTDEQQDERGRKHSETRLGIQLVGPEVYTELKLLEEKKRKERSDYFLAKGFYPPK